MGMGEWTEVARVEWEAPRPPAPNGSCPAGTDYGVTIYEQRTWPQDGSIYAGRTYEQCWVKQGPGPEYRTHVVLSHSTYPAAKATPRTEYVVWGWNPAWDASWHDAPIKLTSGTAGFCATARRQREAEGWKCATYPRGATPAGLRQQVAAQIAAVTS